MTTDLGSHGLPTTIRETAIFVPARPLLYVVMFYLTCVAVYGIVEVRDKPLTVSQSISFSHTLYDLIYPTIERLYSIVQDLSRGSPASHPVGPVKVAK